MRASEIRELVRGFEECSLTREEFTHAAHVAVATWNVLWHGPVRAVDVMRAGIQKFNASVGVAPSPTGGYHDTLTRFYVAYVAMLIRERPAGESLTVLVNEVVELCTDRTIPLRYYSRERLMSAEARAGWVEPDLADLADVGELQLH
ncbi:MAG: hypothetical protein JWO05_3808 [Gemmatimonadetes bacterium]|nr:hypothetical protein [Gemmatimonadota bacterium]